MKKNNKIVLLFILPAMIVTFSLVVYPIIYNAILSCYKTIFNPTMNNVFVGAENYKNLLSSPDFLSIASRTFLWAIINMIGSIVLGFMISLLLIRIEFARAIIMTILFIPWVIPEVAGAMVWKNLLHPVFGPLGVGKGIGLLGDLKIAFFVVSLVNIWRYQCFAMITIFAGLKTTFSRRELYEASSIDGANSLQQLIYITIPLLKKTIFTVGIIIFTWSLTQFTFPQLMTGGGPLGTTELLSIYIYNLSGAWHLGLAATVSLIIFIITSILVIIYVVTLTNK